MRGDVPAPALRLLCELPVRHHERRPYVHKQGSHITLPITISGRKFESIKAAKDKLHIGSVTIERMLSDGRAVRG